MVKSLLLNSSHYKGNSTFSIKLSSQLKAPDEVQAVSVSNISFYNSTFNITSSYGNNKIVLSWLGTNYNITFPDGYYSANDISSFIQDFCVKNTLYMIDSATLKYVYFLELVTNSVRYAIQVNIYPIPTSAQATTLGYTQPSGATWSFPATASTPQMVINSAFGSLIGQEAGTYPSSVQTTPQNILPTKTPVISPVDT